MSVCPICQGTSLVPYYTSAPSREMWDQSRQWIVVQCTACDHRFMDPYPSDTELAAHYDAMYPAYDADHGVDAGFDALIAEARQTGSFRHVTIGEGMRVLDVGCGGGAFLQVARGMGAEVAGVEPSEFGAESCRKAGLQVFHGDLTAYLETCTETYDLITSNHVVEHHPDPVRFLSEMRTLLAPRGGLWIAVPNAGSVFSVMLKGRWHSSDLPVHLQHFTPGSMAKAFLLAGLNAPEIRTESENSIPLSLSEILKQRMKLPKRLTLPLVRALFAKDRIGGRWLDGRNQGEAILAQSTASA